MASLKEGPYARVFCRGKKWSVPKSCFILFSLGKAYSAEEIAEFDVKIKAWGKRSDLDKYIIEMHPSEKQGPEILVLNSTLLEGKDWIELKKSLEQREKPTNRS
jgi:hypothetical protein